MTALQRPIMDVVASGAVVRDLLDTARSSLDGLAEQAAIAMEGTWVQQHQTFTKGVLAKEYWNGNLGTNLSGDPRLSAGIGQSAEGVRLVLDEAARFAKESGDASLAALITSARDRVLDGVAPITLVDRLPGRQLTDHSQVPLASGPQRLETTLQRHSYSHHWASGATFGDSWSANQLATAKQNIDDAARLAERMPESAQLRAPADEIAHETIATLDRSRALDPRASLSSADLAAVANGIDGLAEHIRALDRAMFDDGVLRIVPDTKGTLRIVRAAFDSHVTAVEHVLERMDAISRSARTMAPEHMIRALDDLDAHIAGVRREAGEWTTFIRTHGKESSLDLGRHTAPPGLDRDQFRRVLGLHGSTTKQVAGRFRTRDVSVPAPNTPFASATRQFSAHLTALRELAGEAATGSAAEVAGATSVASAQDAIALARARYTAAMAAVDDAS